MIIEVEKGDTLWGIALLLTGNGERWPELAKHNNIRYPDVIYPGDKIVVPDNMIPAIIEIRHNENPKIGDRVDVMGCVGKITRIDEKAATVEGVYFDHDGEKVLGAESWTLHYYLHDFTNQWNDQWQWWDMSKVKQCGHEGDDE